MASTRHPARVALVTGASRGLGAEIACALAERGVHVVAVARTVGALEAMDDRIRDRGGRATLVPLDLADLEGIDRLSDEIRNRFGRLDMLVHAAGDSLPFTPVRDIDPAGFARLWQTNADAARALIACFESLLEESGGHARFVCDPNATGPYRGAYAATKEALRSLAAAWRAECPNVDIAVVDPPPMATQLRKRGYPGEDPESLASPVDIGLAIARELVAEGSAEQATISPLRHPDADCTPGHRDP